MNMISPEIIKAVQAAGFHVYMRKPEDTWLHYTTPDDIQIAYLQADPRGYVTISTEHRPQMNIGSSFALGAPPDLSRESLLRGFIHAPDWANGPDRRMVVKFKNWDAYKASSTFNRDYERVPE